ncbi:hypothetical protein SETIT_9G280600v2 [Setaria italica]|uniref:Uncharacterized protein n=1 Tax=Setaria italica TaxID=4555 RepID=A0A368SN81_SETIT|nr:hypothetical protein SETIT_9G280600v2 [Setaria italica]
MALAHEGLLRTETRDLRSTRAFGVRRWRDSPQDSRSESCCDRLILDASYQKAEEQSDPTKSTSTSEAG